MKYNRREFIQKSAVAISAVGLSGLPIACGNNQKNLFKYSLCNEILQKFSWPEQCDIIGKAGYDGVEIASFTLVEKGVQEITGGERKQMAQNMKNAGIECAGLHWLLTPPPEGLHFTTPDDQIRNKSVDYLNKLIDFCGDLNGKVMVFGSPAQRGTTGGLSVGESTNYFAEGLAKVADHAKERDVKILIEPLSKNQTEVVNTVKEAVEVVKKVNHPAISSMFDFHNTLDETEPKTELIEKYYEHIHHIHVQNMDGTVVMHDDIPVELVSVIKKLKELNYNKWVSVEVFDFSPGGKFIAEESMKTFKEIESRL